MPRLEPLAHLSPAERRMLLACARCGPIPPRVAHKYYWLSRRQLERLVVQQVLIRTADLVVPTSLRRAFRTHRGAGLPVRSAAYTTSRRALAVMVRRRWIRGWYRLQGARGSAHDLRLLASYLHAPLLIRQTWLCEREVLEAWFRARGLAGADRARAARPRLPDAAFCESGRWIAFEVHNEGRGAVEGHPDIRAKRQALLGGEAYPGWWDEFRVVTLRGAVHRYLADGGTAVVDPAPGRGPSPDGVWPFFLEERPQVHRPLGQPLRDDRDAPWFGTEADGPDADAEEDDWDVDGFYDIR